jgi:hypothetical protein
MLGTMRAEPQYIDFNNRKLEAPTGLARPILKGYDGGMSSGSK